MTEYIIRDATQEDVLDIVLAVKQFCKEIPHPAWSKINTNKINELVTTLIDHEIGFVKLIEHNDEIVGALIAMVAELPINDFKFSQEIMFWIDPEHRNGKTSMKLINEYTLWSEQVGCNFARLSELDSLLSSRAGVLFKRKGYKPIETAYIREI